MVIESVIFDCSQPNALAEMQEHLIFMPALKSLLKLYRLRVVVYADRKINYEPFY
jgi:hypothetical protein